MALRIEFSGATSLPESFFRAPGISAISVELKQVQLLQLGQPAARRIPGLGFEFWRRFFSDGTARAWTKCHSGPSPTFIWLCLKHEKEGFPLKPSPKKYAPIGRNAPIEDAMRAKLAGRPHGVPEDQIVKTCVNCRAPLVSVKGIHQKCQANISTSYT